jgi:hypothetical protein
MLVFVSDDHRTRYEAALARLGDAGSEWRGSLWLMTARPDLWQLAEPHLNYGKRTWGFDAVKMALKRGTWASADMFLLELAHAMFNGDGKPVLQELWTVCGPEDAGLAIMAMEHMIAAWHQLD